MPITLGDVSIGSSSGTVETGANIHIKNTNGTIGIGNAAFGYGNVPAVGRASTAGFHISGSAVGDLCIGAEFGKSVLIGTGASGTLLRSMQIDGSGRVMMPYQPGFALERSSGELSYTGTNEVITGFNQAITNVGNHMNVGTGTFTAPVAGRYLFQASLWHNQNISSQVGIGFFINGTQWDETRTAEVSGRYHKAILVSIMTLAANDTVQLRTSSFNQHTMVAATVYNKYSGCLLG